MSWRIAMAVAAVVLAARADAQSRGSSGSPFTAPPTKSAGVEAERADLGEREVPIEPRHGVLAAPGSAPDAYGPTRLGPGAARSSTRAYGEAAPGSGTASSTWQSGDRVRSLTSADVRAARQQQAPDLEITPPGSAPAQQGGAAERKKGQER